MFFTELVVTGVVERMVDYEGLRICTVVIFSRSGWFLQCSVGGGVYTLHPIHAVLVEPGHLYHVDRVDVHHVQAGLEG